MDGAVRLAGVRVPASDPERLGRWYSDHLGVDTTSWPADPAALLVLPTGRHAPTDQTAMSIIGEVRDLDATVARLRAAGVAVDVDPEEQLFERRARLVDPEGNQVELRQPPGLRLAGPGPVGEPGERRRTAGRWAAVIIGLVLLFVAASAVVMLTGANDSAEAEAELDQVRAVDRDIRHALVAADLGVLQRNIAPAFVLVPPPGEPLSRGEYLQAVASGALDFRVFEPVSEVHGRLSGDLAVLTYAADNDVTFGKTKAHHTIRVTHVYERRDDRWLLVSGQSTGVGGFPPPGPA